MASILVARGEGTVGNSPFKEGRWFGEIFGHFNSQHLGYFSNLGVVLPYFLSVEAAVRSELTDQGRRIMKLINAP